MILKGSDALKFLLVMKHYENIKVGPVPTPKLDKAKELIQKYKQGQRKFSRSAQEYAFSRGNLSK